MAVENNHCEWCTSCHTEGNKDGRLVGIHRILTTFVRSSAESLDIIEKEIAKTFPLLFAHTIREITDSASDVRRQTQTSRQSYRILPFGVD